MQEWEYKILGASASVEAMNVLGEQGWEQVATITGLIDQTRNAPQRSYHKAILRYLQKEWHP